MKKALKVILWSVVGLFTLVLVLLATMPLWIGTVARPLVNEIAPKITKTKFNIGKLYVNPWTGRIEVGDFVLGNPEGYSDPDAVALKSLIIDIDMTKTIGGAYWVELVEVNGLFASYEIGGENKVDNVKQILMNVAGGKEKYEAQQKRQEAQDATDDAKQAPEEATEEGEDEPMKFVVERLSLSDIKLKLQVLTIPVPGFTLTDIGKDSGGASIGDIINEVWKSILSGASSVGDGAKALGGLINSGADATAEAVGEGAKKTADAVKKIFNFK